MKKLTEKEEEIMNCFWSDGPMYVRQLLECLPDPKPHFNTASTFVRILEEKGFLTHKRTGNSFLYSPVISRSEYSSSELRKVVDRYFESSAMNVVSTLVSEQGLTEDEVNELIRLVESHRR